VRQEHGQHGAAEAGQHIGLAQRGAHPAGDLQQHRIAAALPHGVVDAAQVVGVDQQHGAVVTVAAAACPVALGQAQELATVAHTGQLVVHAQQLPLLARLGQGPRQVQGHMSGQQGRHGGHQPPSKALPQEAWSRLSSTAATTAPTTRAMPTWNTWADRQPRRSRVSDSWWGHCP
jgi:hypothetical protein